LTRWYPGFIFVFYKMYLMAGLIRSWINIISLIMAETGSIYIHMMNLVLSSAL
jgi:hypothetical protein